MKQLKMEQKNKNADLAYVINLDEFKLIGTHWIALFVVGNNIIYLDILTVQHIQKQIKKIYRKQ